MRHCRSVCCCRAGFWDLYASPDVSQELLSSSSSNADLPEWVQWVDVRSVIQKCAVAGEQQQQQQLEGALSVPPFLTLGAAAGVVEVTATAGPPLQDDHCAACLWATATVCMHLDHGH